MCAPQIQEERCERCALHTSSIAQLLTTFEPLVPVGAEVREGWQSWCVHCSEATVRGGERESARQAARDAPLLLRDVIVALPSTTINVVVVVLIQFLCCAALWGRLCLCAPSHVLQSFFLCVEQEEKGRVRVEAETPRPNAVQDVTAQW